MKWNADNTITVEVPSKPKKITGTRFGAVLGVNVWNTPFKAWCDITKTYIEPFEDTKYTIAGKTIEPKQAEYIKETYFLPDLVTPSMMFGADYFDKTHGDFFKNEPIFGGMWDYIDPERKILLEMKTTKRVEDWKDDIPEYYALQGALYAYLLGYEEVWMVCSILQDEDYDFPEFYVPSVNNTIIRPFKVHERYPKFEELIEEAETWYKEHVLTGVSPKYQETRDADILKVLRTTTLAPDTDLEALIKEAEILQNDLDESKKNTAKAEKRLKEITNIFKEYGTEQLVDGLEKMQITGGRYTWTVSKTEGTELDKKALEADGLMEKYSIPKTTYRITVKENK